MGELIDAADPLVGATSLLATRLGGITILRKGRIDVASNGHNAVFCNAQGSRRRVGGQGDILSGVCGTFVGWAAKKKPLSSQQQQQEGKEGEGENKGIDEEDSRRLLACLAASLVGVSVFLSPPSPAPASVFSCVSS